MSETKFLTYCKLTCVGGSEVGECPCPNPNACELVDDPDFAYERNQAIKRLWSRVDTKAMHPVLREAVELRAGGPKKDPS